MPNFDNSITGRIAQKCYNCLLIGSTVLTVGMLGWLGKQYWDEFDCKEHFAKKWNNLKEKFSKKK